jgi:hypothetical protein
LLSGGTSGFALNDLWTFNLPDQIWLRVYPTTHAPWPRARYGQSTLVTANQKMYIFGGGTSGLALLNFLNDIWMLDLVTLQWTEVIPSSPKNASLPPARNGHAWALIDSDLVLMQGGTNISHYFLDTWVWNMTSLQWTELSNLAQHPPELAYSTLNTVLSPSGTLWVVLYGGWNITTLTQPNIWLLNVTDPSNIAGGWTLAVFGPSSTDVSGRGMHATTQYSPFKIVVSGGLKTDPPLIGASSSSIEGYFDENDLWVWAPLVTIDMIPRAGHCALPFRMNGSSDASVNMIYSGLQNTIEAPLVLLDSSDIQYVYYGCNPGSFAPTFD